MDYKNAANVGYFQAADAASINIIIAEVNLLASRGLLGLNTLLFEQVGSCKVF